MAEVPTVLVAGAAKVGKHSLISRIQQLSDSSKAPLSTSTEHGVLITIKTKYYVAGVNMRKLRLPLDSEPALGYAVEAAVLVVDAQQSSSFYSAQKLVDSIDLDEAQVKLLVVTKVDQLSGMADDSGAGRLRPTWLQEAESWCINSGFEYIEACAVDDALDAQLVDVDGEQQGVRRVLAALSAHTWPNMMRVPSMHQSSHHATESIRPLDDDTTPLESAEARGAYQPLVGKERENGKAAEANVGSRHEDSSDELGDDEDEDEDEDDADMAVFEQLMVEMQGAKARLATLPDNERRNAAALLALKFANLLGEDDTISEDNLDEDSFA